MVFPSVPAYLDPPNWNNQQGQQPRASGGGEGSGDAAEHMPVGPTAAALASSSAAGNEAAGQQQQQARPNPHSMTEHARMARAPHPEPALKCPRCDSTNTKFCYYNNYSLSQPRHFCKACRRYWTRGGALRSVPVGGGCRRNKRSSNKSSSSKPSSSSANRQQLPGGASSSASILPSTAPGSGVPSGGMIPPVGLGSSMAHHLPFLGSMQQHPPGAGPNLGLAFSVGLPPLGIGMHQQQHNMDGVDQSSFPLASGGGAATFGASLEQQWRVQQQQPHQQQFPFLEFPPGPPMYQLGALQGNRAAGSSAAAPSGMFTLGQTAASATATAARHERSSVKQAADDDSKGGQEMSLHRQYMEALRQQGDQGVWGGSGAATDDGNNGSGSWTMNLPGFHSSSTGGHGGGLL